MSDRRRAVPVALSKKQSESGAALRLPRRGGRSNGRQRPGSERAKTNGPPTPLVADPVESAREAGLRYVLDSSPGIQRRRQGKGFVYLNPDGRRVTDPETLARIVHLVIPPAWKDVWISPVANGHIQAIGYDDRGRKQYRYHEKWREVRDQNKYERLIAFVQALPRIRRRIARDLRKPGLCREKVLAAVVRLLETTFIRVGNEEYKKQNHSYGLTTMGNRHAEVHGSHIHFNFRGKSGVKHAVDLSDRRLAKIVRACQELPGEELFEYCDSEGNIHNVGSSDVNEYLKEIIGQDFTAKDFRTWAGTVLAARALQEFVTVDSQARRKKNVIEAVDAVAKKLGNTRSVCRKCYIHPAILHSYLDGSFVKTAAARAQELERNLHHLRPEEAAVLVLLQRGLRSQ